jgi:hypothetical protein
MPPSGFPTQTRPGGAEAAARPKARPPAELSIVKLGMPVETKQGTVPSGSSGTVVHVFQDGRAYIVEFYEPFHTVATVEADAITA